MPTWIRVLLEGGGAGGVNFRAAVRPALALRSLLTGVAAHAAPAILLSRHVLTAVTLERSALALSTVISGTAARPATTPGMLVTMRSAGTLARPPTTPGMRVVRTSVDLIHRAGGNAVTETAVGGRTDWTNDANATGRDNGTLASFAGSALGARGGQLEFDYANLTGKGALTISAVRLHFYVRVAGTVLNNGDLRLGWLKSGGAFTELETITGDVDSLTAPRTFDITASITGWADLDGLRTMVRAESSLGEVWTADADAVELEVVAASVV